MSISRDMGINTSRRILHSACVGAEDIVAVVKEETTSKAQDAAFLMRAERRYVREEITQERREKERRTRRS